MSEAQSTLGSAPVVEQDASRALFRLGRLFARLPLPRGRFGDGEFAHGHEPELTTIQLLQAVEEADTAGDVATVGFLATQLGIDPSTASRLVAHAVRSGYLHRVTVASDGRAVMLALTDTGRDVTVGAAHYQRAVFDTATEGWPSGDRIQFARLFVRFASSVATQLATTPSPPLGDHASTTSGEKSRSLAIVALWHGALNAGDPDRLVGVTHPDVEMVGPRGAVAGRDPLRDWASHAGISLEPRQWFQRGDQIIVEQSAQWQDAATGDWGEPMTIATVFTVRESLIDRIARYPDLSSAFTDTGLSTIDAVSEPAAVLSASSRLCGQP